MTNLIDLTGRRVNKLTVLRRADTDGHQPAWVCICDCGREKTVLGMHLRAGRPKSCGCATNAAISSGLRRHGMTGSVEWRSWVAMRDRCMNPRNKAWKHYGGRGITVCQRWQESFENFYADMGARPPGTSLDRKDNSLGYTPENCRWATEEEQHNNKRSNVLVDLDGDVRTMAAWARHFKVPYAVVKARHAAGVTGRALFAASPRKPYRWAVTHNGLSKTITEWAAHLGVPYIVVWKRVAAGLPPSGGV